MFTDEERRLIASWRGYSGRVAAGRWATTVGALASDLREAGVAADVAYEAALAAARDNQWERIARGGRRAWG